MPIGNDSIPYLMTEFLSIFKEICMTINVERRVMSYDAFTKEIELQLKNYMGENGTVHLHTVIKNNGKRRVGITFIETEVNISPTIYLEEYYQQFLQGESMNKILSQMMKLYGEVRAGRDWESDYIECYNQVEEHIICHLVNKEKNEERLQDIPYISYLDLAVIFQLVADFNEEEGRIATMQIKHEHLKWWKITVEELYEKAKKNTERILPYEFSTMYAVISEIMEKKGEKREKEDDDMYVLTNQLRNHGAATILYKKRLEKIGEYLGESYYVLPSSVHEVIIIPESKSPEAEELDMIITDINDTQVEAEEVLSNRAYYYNISTKELK